MKVELIEKRDNEIIVKLTGTSAMDATLLGMVKMGPTKDDATLQSTSGPWSKGYLTISSFSFDMIDLMQIPEPKP
jgi:hypothetical protein